MPKELKSCPFCGSEAASIKIVENKATVRCENCLAVVRLYNTTEEAIAAWNRRMQITNYNDTKVYLKKKGEICSTICDECPLSNNNNGRSLNCNTYEQNYPTDAIAKVKEWHKKKEKKYTYRDDFLDKYPKALTTTDSYPKDTFMTNPISPCSVYPQIRHKVVECDDCGICWDMKKGGQND